MLAAEPRHRMQRRARRRLRQQRHEQPPRRQRQRHRQKAQREVCRPPPHRLSHWLKGGFGVIVPPWYGAKALAITKTI